MTHRELVAKGAEWLKRSGYNIVLTEIVTSLPEIPDVIGWKGSDSVLIECKASRSDFLKDKEKHHRHDESKRIGQRRYFLAPKGIIAVTELPLHWGLLELVNDEVKVTTRAAELFNPDISSNELVVLLHLLKKCETLGIKLSEPYSDILASKNLNSIKPKTPIGRIRKPRRKPPRKKS